MEPPSHKERNDWEDEPTHAKEGVIVMAAASGLGTTSRSTPGLEQAQHTEERAYPTDDLEEMLRHGRIPYYFYSTNVTS